MKNILFLLAALSTFIGCSSITQPNPAQLETTTPTTAKKLVFQSGFETGCQLVDADSASPKITGTDSSLKDFNSWDELKKEVSTLSFNFTGGDTSKRFVKIANDPTNPSNRVLHYKIIEPWIADGGAEKARLQFEYYNIKGGYKEYWQSVRIFLPVDMAALQSYPSKISWFTIVELWNNITWSVDVPNGFRITLGLGKSTSTSSELNFILDAQDCEFTSDGQQKYTTIWSRESEVKVPIGKWFTLEYHFKEGSQETGQFDVTIQAEGESSQVVFRVPHFTNNTKDPKPTGLTDFNPMKMYTSKEVANYMKSLGKSLEIYWDDLKIWKKE